MPRSTAFVPGDLIHAFRFKLKIYLTFESLQATFKLGIRFVRPCSVYPIVCGIW